jgi:hypothetical protein
VLVLWTWNHHVLSIYWLSIGGFVPSEWRALEKLESCHRVRADLRCYEKRALNNPSKARVRVVASEPRFECGARIATTRGDGGGVGRWWRESVVDEVDGGGP